MHIPTLQLALGYKESFLFSVVKKTARSLQVFRDEVVSMDVNKRYSINLNSNDGNVAHAFFYFAQLVF